MGRQTWFVCGGRLMGRTGENAPNGTGAEKYPVPWAGEVLGLIALTHVGHRVEYPLFHRNLTCHAKDGRDRLHHEYCPWWDFEVVPHLKILHKQETDVDRFYRVGFKQLNNDNY